MKNNIDLNDKYLRWCYATAYYYSQIQKQSFLLNLCATLSLYFNEIAIPFEIRVIKLLEQSITTVTWNRDGDIDSDYDYSNDKEYLCIDEQKFLNLVMDYINTHKPINPNFTKFHLSNPFIKFLVLLRTLLDNGTLHQLRNVNIFLQDDPFIVQNNNPCSHYIRDQEDPYSPIFCPFILRDDDKDYYSKALGSFIYYNSRKYIIKFWQSLIEPNLNRIASYFDNRTYNQGIISVDNDIEPINKDLPFFVFTKFVSFIFELFDYEYERSQDPKIQEKYQQILSDEINILIKLKSYFRSRLLRIEYLLVKKYIAIGELTKAQKLTQKYFKKERLCNYELNSILLTAVATNNLSDIYTIEHIIKDIDEDTAESVFDTHSGIMQLKKYLDQNPKEKFTLPNELYKKYSYAFNLYSLYKDQQLICEDNAEIIYYLYKNIPEILFITLCKGFTIKQITSFIKTFLDEHPEANEFVKLYNEYMIIYREDKIDYDLSGKTNLGYTLFNFLEDYLYKIFLELKEDNFNTEITITKNKANEISIGINHKIKIKIEEEDFNKIHADSPLSSLFRSNKLGRNDPCPCGSGKKYKKCCMLKPDNPFK